MGDEPTPTPDPTDGPDARNEPTLTPDEPDDIDAMRKALKKANEEAKNHRLKLKELEPLAAKAAELEEAQKSETEKLTERLSASEKRAVEAELRAARLEVAAAKGLNPQQAKYLTGTTPEELEQAAEELIELFTAGDPAPSLPGKPKPRLRGGSQPSSEPEMTPEEMARAVQERQGLI
jgi:hypothetical protein